MIEVLNCYSVLTKCGHVGRKFYVQIAFPITAKNKKEAAYIARNYSRVKHDHKDAIIKVERITYAEYLILMYINKNDPYLKCRNKAEQNLIANFNKRILTDEYYYENLKRKKKRKKERNLEYKRLKDKYMIQSYNKELNLYLNNIDNL